MMAQGSIFEAREEHAIPPSSGAGRWTVVEDTLIRTRQYLPSRELRIELG
jgi:hypothetical protein